MESSNTQLDELVKYLTYDIGKTVGEIADEIEIGRTTFYRIMKGENSGKRSSLARKLLEKYPEHFPNGQVPQRNSTAGPAEIQLRYIEMLEKSLAKSNAELDQLKTENAELLREIKRLIEEMRSSIP